MRPAVQDLWLFHLSFGLNWQGVHLRMSALRHCRNGQPLHAPVTSSHPFSLRHMPYLLWEPNSFEKAHVQPSARQSICLHRVPGVLQKLRIPRDASAVEAWNRKQALPNVPRENMAMHIPLLPGGACQPGWSGGQSLRLHSLPTWIQQGIHAQGSHSSAHWRAATQVPQL